MANTINKLRKTKIIYSRHLSVDMEKDREYINCRGRSHFGKSCKISVFS